MTDESVADGFEWAIVEIFGHRRHAGRAREEERFGTKMLRVDVPIDGDTAKGWQTHFYGGGAIFSFSLADEATVMRANAPYRPFRLTAPTEPPPSMSAGDGAPAPLDLFGQPIDDGPDDGGAGEWTDVEPSAEA